LIRAGSLALAGLCALWLAVLPTRADAPNLRPEHRNDQPPSVIPADLDPCRYFDAPGEPMVNFTLEMDEEDRLVPMRVPRRYLDRSPIGEGEVTLNALFSTFEVHSFEPLPRGEPARRNREGESWDWMSFIIGDDPSLERNFGVPLRRNDLPFGDPRMAEEWENPPHPRDLPSRPAAYGLTEVLVPPNRGIDIPGSRDFFVHYGSDGELEGWFRCSVAGVGGTQNENCEHYFRAAGVDAKASYRRTELPNWRTIQSNVTRFLACATDPARLEGREG
jgi:hypothetical protein